MNAKYALTGLAISMVIGAAASPNAYAQSANPQSADTRAAGAQPTSDATSSFIEAYARETAFSGVVLVTQNGSTLYRESFGAAERTFGAPIEAATRFPVASITKLFVSTLVLQLVDEGRVGLDAAIGAYVDDLPNAAYNAITLRQLLNHTSGVPQFDRIASYQDAFDHGIASYQRPVTLDEALSLCCSAALDHSPGAVFDYNNADYFLVQRILERVSGKSLAELLQERIIAPLRLDDTGVLDWRAINAHLASTYFKRPDTGEVQRDMPVYWENWRAAGAMYATAGDLNRFADALFAGDLISAASRRELLRPGLDEYGLGLWSYSFRRHGRTYHVAKRPGSIMGANAVLYRLRERNLNIIILANTNASDLDIFAQRLAERWIDQTRHRRARDQ